MDQHPRLKTTFPVERLIAVRLGQLRGLGASGLPISWRRIGWCAAIANVGLPKSIDRFFEAV
ncbi:MAG: hypothetical protein AAF716_11905, partial [Cyanobacteria bacterium P01_D01_bin.1]